jgi:hypothetical protein
METRWNKVAVDQFNVDRDQRMQLSRWRRSERGQEGARTVEVVNRAVDEARSGPVDDDDCRRAGKEREARKQTMKK